MMAGGQSFFICVARALLPASQAAASTGPTTGMPPSTTLQSALTASCQASIPAVQSVRLTELSCGVHGSGGLSRGWPPHSTRQMGKHDRGGSQPAMQSSQHCLHSLDAELTAQGRSCAGWTPVSNCEVKCANGCQVTRALGRDWSARNPGRFDMMSPLRLSLLEAVNAVARA